MDSPEVPSGVPVHTIREAARLLGVSDDAIRQRIRRGTIPAEKHKGVWYVQVTPPRSAPQGEDASREDSPEPTKVDVREASSPLVQEAMSRSLRAVAEEMIAPLVAAAAERETALARRVGQLESERDAALRELVRVRAERDAREPLGASPEAPGSPAPAASGGGLLGRLRRLIGG
jgi:hypothetical protein